MKVSELKENIRGIIRKKMNEAVIDVPNPATETPQTKKQKIDMARRTTGNKNLGTEKDPVEFIEEVGEYTMDKINKMTRTELIDFAGFTPQEAAKYSTRALQNIALELTDDKESIEEKDFMDDDDNTIIEDVEDVDSSGDEMAKYYDEIYEINANVAPGSRYQIEVSKDGNFIVLKQDNGYEIVVHPDDVKDLVKVILKMYNEAD
jgi:uncharacterized phage infection (PIP) family protein YhgE